MDFDRFVGVPWQERGRTLDGADCWGLAILVLKAGRGLELPSHDGLYASTADRAELAGIIAGQLGPWQPVTAGSERPYDLVLIREGGQPHHIGIVVRRGMMLHMPRDHASVVEPYTTGRYAPRVAGIYRHEALA